MKGMISLFVLLLGAGPLSAQINNDHSPHRHEIRRAPQDFFGKHMMNFHLYNQKFFFTSGDTMTQTSVLKEMGYVLAMEATFSGMSYLASRRKGYGPAIAGGFDVFMGLAGLKNASLQKSGIPKAGHYLISAGFIAKSLYNFRFNKNHSKNTRFWINFIGFNALVFTGYFLDTLN